MATADENVVQAAFSIADEIDGVALAIGMPKSQREQINTKLQERLKTFAEAILDQAVAASLSEQAKMPPRKSRHAEK